MTLAGRRMCDESLWITMDLLKLIVGCITGCQLSHQSMDSQRIVSCVSSNLGPIIFGIAGYYGLTVILDFLPLLLTENIELWADFLKIHLEGGE